MAQRTQYQPLRKAWVAMFREYADELCAGVASRIGLIRATNPETVSIRHDELPALTIYRRSKSEGLAALDNVSTVDVEFEVSGFVHAAQDPDDADERAERFADNAEYLVRVNRKLDGSVAGLRYADIEATEFDSAVIGEGDILVSGFRMSVICHMTAAP